MRKYLSNCNGTMGVRTRSKARASSSSATAALSSSSTSVKKMKKSSDKVPDIQNRRRLAVVSDENFRPEAVVINSSSEVVVVVETTVDCSGGEVVSADFPAPCCSSSNDNGSISNNILVDLEVVESAETMSSRHLHLDNNNNEERIKKTLELENLDSPVMRSLSRKPSVEIKMTSDSEIDAFFAAAEKDVQKRFMDRYNFDVVKDVPLEGRYEWVPIKPFIPINKNDKDDDC